MKDANPVADRPAARYEIQIKGELDERWTTWFDGLDVTVAGDGTTVISGSVADQAALHGLLQKARDLGLPLISVRRIELRGDDVTSNQPPSARGDTQ